MNFQSMHPESSTIKIYNLFVTVHVPVHVDQPYSVDRPVPVDNPVPVRVEHPVPVDRPYKGKNQLNLS